MLDTHCQQGHGVYGHAILSSPPAAQGSQGIHTARSQLQGPICPGLTAHEAFEAVAVPGGLPRELVGDRARKDVPYSTGSCLACSTAPCKCISPEGDGHALLHASGAGSQSMRREESPGCFQTLNWLGGGRSTDNGVTSWAKQQPQITAWEAPQRFTKQTQDSQC